MRRFLSRTSRTPFDLVFLDPPYSRGLGFVARVLEKLANGAWVHRGTTIVVEAQEGEVDWPARFHETRTRKFGRTLVSMAVTDGNEGDIPGDV